MVKTAKKIGRAVKQRGNSAKGTRGKPFEKGNPHAFQPGQSGNPAGRPKKRTLTEDLRAGLEEKYPRRSDATYQRMVVEALVDRAINGDVVAIKEVFDRLQGKPRQAIDLTIEQKKREMAENIIEAFMADAGVSDHDEAARLLAAAHPEISEWVN